MSEQREGAGRIILASELYYPEETSTGYIMTTIAEALASEYSVMAVCGRPSYRSKGSAVKTHEVRAGVQITRVRSTTFERHRVAARSLNAATLSAGVMVELLGNARPRDVVMCVTNPPTLPMVAAIASAAKGCRLVSIVHDLYPETLNVLCGMSAKSRAFRAATRMREWVFRRSSIITVLGRDMADTVCRTHKGVAARVRVIPNFCEPSLTPSPKTSNRLLRELGLTSKFVVGVAGNLGVAQDIELLAATAALVVKEDIEFVFVGDGRKREWLLREVAARGLNNVHVLGPKPRAEQNDFVAACDIGAITLKPGTYGLSVPSRLYNLLAVGRPVLAVVDPGSEVARVVEEEEVGWVSNATPESCCELLRRLRENPGGVAEAGERALRAARKYSIQHTVDAYKSVVRAL